MIYAKKIVETIVQKCLALEKNALANIDNFEYKDAQLQCQ